MIAVMKTCTLETIYSREKYVRLRGLTYIHTRRSYIYTPREIDSHKSLEASHYNKGALADSSDFGLLAEQSSRNGRFPALDDDEPPFQNSTPLVLSTAMKSVTVQKQVRLSSGTAVYPHMPILRAHAALT